MGRVRRQARYRPGERVGDIDGPEGLTGLPVVAPGDKRVGPLSFVDDVGVQRLEIVGAQQPERGGRVEGHVQQGFVKLAFGQFGGRALGMDRLLFPTAGAFPRGPRRTPARPR